ncbi:MAG: dihydrodipicolinate synthase family protein [Pirellulales bacterium]
MDGVAGGGILAACVVPWDADGRFLAEPFRRQVRAIASSLTTRLYLFGTAGEGYEVTERQFDEIVDVFCGECAGLAIDPMVGLISLSTGTLVERIERCRARGVRQFQISLPAWHAVDDRELAAFFRATCGRFEDCRFLHYNLLRTKRLLNADDYARLAAEHQNLFATKNTGMLGDDLRKLLDQTPTITHYLGERGLAQTRPGDNVGLLASISTISAARCREFYEACRTADAATRNRLAEEIFALGALLRETVGQPPRIDGAYDKLLWALHDPEFPLRLLPPYSGSTCEMLIALRNAVAERFPSWRSESA